MVKPEVMHVSLLFLGEVNPELIINRLTSVSFKQFTATVEGVAFFPNDKRPRVIYSPVIKGFEEFKSLHDLIIKALGLKPERFTPHATLARVKSIIDLKKLVSVSRCQVFKESFKVDHFNLYSSRLTPNGPVHAVLQSFNNNV